MNIKKLRTNYNLTFEFDKRLQSYIKSFPREHKKLFKEEVLQLDGTVKAQWVTQVREVQMGNVISFLLDNSYPFALDNFTKAEMGQLRQLYLERQNRIREALKAKADSIQVDDEDYSFMKIEPYDYQKQAVKFMEINEGVIMLGDEPGVGKSLFLETPICTDKGWIRMGDISLDSSVLGSDGEFHKVTGVYPQGLLDAYEVTFNDGSKVKCCEEHLWTVRDANRRQKGAGWTVKSIAELIKSGLSYKTNKKRIDSGRKPVLKWEIPTIQPANFPEKKYVIHPFILGSLIGDGAISSSTPTMSIPDFQESTASLIESNLLPGMKMAKIKKSESTQHSCSRYSISDTLGQKNRYTDEIRRLKLNVKSHYKFIPQEYRNGSTEQRTELLKGLMDTDRSCSNSRTHYHTVSKQLAEDVKELTQSLGGIAKVFSYDRTHEQKGVEYRVNVKLNWAPFHLDDKIKEHKIVATNHTSRYIESIEYIGVLPQQCISVDSDDSTFVVNDYIVTHNTAPAFAYAIKHNLKTLVICPASLKLNWKSEIEKFSHEKSFVYKYNPTKRSGKTNNTKEESLFHIINFESIQTFIKLEYNHRCTGTLFSSGGNRNCDCKITSLKKKITDDCPQCANTNSFKSRIKGLQYIIDKDGEVLDPDDYDLIIIDEFHRIKERTTDWTKIINMAFRESVSKKVLLSGTAIKSRPIELFMPLNLLDKDMWNSFHDFGVRYGAGFEDSFGWKYDGASYLEELYQRISPFYLRRLKKDVLSQLPPKTYSEVVLEMDIKTKREYNKAEKEVIKFINEEGKEDEKEMSFLAKVHLLKKCTETFKLEKARDFIDDIIESGDKVVIFFDYIDTGNAIKELWGDRCVLHTGQMNAIQKHESVTSFQEKKNINVFGGTFGSAGVGITLTSANKLIFIGQAWTPADMGQAEDRIHRATTTHDNVQIMTFLCEDSIDIDIYELLKEKNQVVSKVLDNKDFKRDVSRGDESIISRLMNRMAD